MGLIPGEEVDSRYLYMWLGSIDLASLADGSNVPQINHGDLADQVLNLPPIDEQVRIAATADVYFDHIAALGGTVEHSFVRVGHLRSQVLTAAVSGTLTPHDPAEEPASALLERFAHESRNDKRTVRSEKSKRARKGVAA